MSAIERSREIAKHRAPGETIHYDPDLHPGIVKRCALAGYKPADIAALLGVSPATFRRWMEANPALAEMLEQGSMLRDAEVLESVYDQAVGYLDDKGRRRGANVTAAKFIIMNRFGWTDKTMPKASSEADKDISIEDLERRAAELLNAVKAKRADEATPVVVDGKFTEFD